MLSEIRKDKMKLIKDPIKRMSYNGNGSAREVVRMIALALGFKIHEDEYGISAYGGNAIRIADHCTYMQTWVDRGTWNAPIRLDVVIEEEPTQAVTQVKKGYDFTIVEFVYNITDVDTQNARTITYDIRNVINGNQYANNTRGERRALKSTHNSNENKQYNKNRNMKQTIRLTENELKHIISESVKTILKENFADNAKTNFAYAKNVVKNNLPPVGMKHPKMAIDSIKFYIKCMEEAIQNKEKCSPRFLFHYRVSMETAEEDGYVKYYKKMKELYNQMVELGLYEDESDINPMSFKDMFGDLKKRVEKRGGYFHG